MLVTVNGQTRELPARSTIASIVESLSAAPEGRGVAVAVEGEVVPRGLWTATEISEGAHVEVVAAIQGG
jgi:sulfur carrier protein